MWGSCLHSSSICRSFVYLETVLSSWVLVILYLCAAWSSASGQWFPPPLLRAFRSWQERHLAGTLISLSHFTCCFVNSRRSVTTDLSFHRRVHSSSATPLHLWETACWQLSALLILGSHLHGSGSLSCAPVSHTST